MVQLKFNICDLGGGCGCHDDADYDWEASLLRACEGVNSLRIPIGTKLGFETNETVYVKDGTECRFTMTPSGVFKQTNVRISREMEGEEFLLLEEESVYVNGENYMTQIQGDFAVISTCLLRDLFGGSPAMISEQTPAAYSALRWVNRYPIEDGTGFGCGEPLLKQRYALAVLNHATGDILQEKNDWLESEFHCVQWGSLICDEHSRLVQLIFVGLGLDGTLPREIGYLSDIRMLGQANNLDGAIPSEIGTMTGDSSSDDDSNMPEESLKIGSSGLSGRIPTEIGLLTNLVKFHDDYFDSQGSKFSGHIPSEIGLLAGLTILDLSNNAFSGTLPSEIGRLTNLKTFAIYANNFSGKIPTESGLMTDLEYIQLWENSLTGPIPSEMGLLTKLSKKTRETLQGKGKVFWMPVIMVLDHYLKLTVVGGVVFVGSGIVAMGLGFSLRQFLCIHLLTFQFLDTP